MEEPTSIVTGAADDADSPIHHIPTGFAPRRGPQALGNSYEQKWGVCRERAQQRLADETGLQISVCHFPPGTSKWNKIEHSLFSFIARNWRGRPLVSRQAVVSLIGATTSTAGLKVYAQLDEGAYKRGVKVSDAELAAVNLARDEFHGEWNYVIKPQAC